MLNRMSAIKAIEHEFEEPSTPLDFPEFSQPNKDDEWYNDYKGWQKDICIPMKTIENKSRASFSQGR